MNPENVGCVRLFFRLPIDEIRPHYLFALSIICILGERWLFNISISKHQHYHHPFIDAIHCRLLPHHLRLRTRQPRSWLVVPTFSPFHRSLFVLVRQYAYGIALRQARCSYLAGYSICRGCSKLPLPIMIASFGEDRLCSSTLGFGGLRWHELLRALGRYKGQNLLPAASLFVAVPHHHQ